MRVCRVVSVENGAYSQRTVLARPAARGGVVTAATLLPGAELVLAVRQDLDSVAGEGALERYRAVWDDPLSGDGPLDFDVPFGYSTR